MDAKPAQFFSRSPNPSRWRYRSYAIALHVVVFVILASGFAVHHHDASIQAIEASVHNSIPKDQQTVHREQLAHAHAMARAKHLAAMRAAQEARALRVAHMEKMKAQKAARVARAHALAKARVAAMARANATKARAAAIAYAKAQAFEQAKQEKLAQVQKQQALAAKQAALAKAKAQAAMVDQYRAQIKQAISQMWVIPQGLSKDLSCVLSITLAQDGMVLKVRLLKSSGQSVLDQSAIHAIYAASPLPVPSNPALFSNFHLLRLTLRPEKIVPQI